MLNSKRFLLPTVLLLVAVAAVAYLLVQNSELRTALAAAGTPDATPADAALAAYDRLNAADELLFDGRHADARTAYQRIQRDTANRAVAGLIGRRLERTRELEELIETVQTLRAAAGRPAAAPPAAALEAPRARPVARMQLSEARPNDYDSLTFALQKADMRIRNLQGQLLRKTGGQYLTFKSRQGNDVYFIGEIENGMANGRGVALLSSGSRYMGDWKDNRRHGVGEFHWSDGAYYEGEYEEGFRSGRGTYHFASGDVFVGEWDKDVRNGEGIFYNKEGDVVARGTWRDDELVEQQ